METAVSTSRQRRSTWVLGGILLIIAALVDVVLRVTALVGSGWIPGLIFLLAVIVFVAGIGSAGSVTARRPFGTISALVFAVAVPLSSLPYLLFPPMIVVQGDMKEELVRSTMLAAVAAGSALPDWRSGSSRRCRSAVRASSRGRGTGPRSGR